MNFIYNDNEFDGLFNYFRNTKPSSISSIKLTSPNYLDLSDGFCETGYSGSDASSIIDGSSTNCWGNKNTDNESECYVEIDLGINLFILQHFTYRSVCVAPNTIKILGSNDNTIEYNEICTLNNFDEYSTKNQKCQNGSNSYRFFKIKQIGMNKADDYRFHIAEIEFFGILKPLYRIDLKTCNIHKIIHFNVFVYILFLI